jgi:hypothetical protein
LRKLKILAATLAMTLLFAAPAFATVLGETEVELGPEANEVRLEHEFFETEVAVGGDELGTEFLSETEVEAGNFTLLIGSPD